MRLALRGFAGGFLWSLFMIGYLEEELNLYIYVKIAASAF